MPSQRFTVRVLPAGPSLELGAGETLYAALAPRLPGFRGTCGGRGLCGQCRIRMAPAPPPLAVDRALLNEVQLREGWRLACRHAPRGRLEIWLPEPASRGPRLSPGYPLPPPDPYLRFRPVRGGGFAIVAGRRVLERVPSSDRPLLAAALDIGTTNVSLQLLDLSVPAVLGTATAENPQIGHGEDILSRLKMASDPRGLGILQRLVIGGVNDLLASLKAAAGHDGHPVHELALAANPVMACIFVGTDPAPLARPPYLPPVLPAVMEGRNIPGLALHPRALIRLLPAVGAFVGGDITGGLAHAGVLADRTRRTFYLDLGTNSEMVLRAGSRWWAASTAAGPALEGRKISAGMRAEAGAIDAVTFGAALSVSVIGGGAPRGICGSGLLDLLAGLVGNGLLDGRGRLLSAGEAAHYPRPGLAALLRDHTGQRAFLVAAGPAGDLLLSQADIRELQLAKGAIRAGADILLAHGGIAVGEVERVVIAGTFGFNLRAASLTGAGFLPREWLGRIEFLGNAALAGARECLLFRSTVRRLAALPGKVVTLNLAGDPLFQTAFVARLDF